MEPKCRVIFIRKLRPEREGKVDWSSSHIWLMPGGAGSRVQVSWLPGQLLSHLPPAELAAPSRCPSGFLGSLRDAGGALAGRVTF